MQLVKVAEGSAIAAYPQCTVAYEPSVVSAVRTESTATTVGELLPSYVSCMSHGRQVTVPARSTVHASLRLSRRAFLMHPQPRLIYLD